MIKEYVCVYINRDSMYILIFYFRYEFVRNVHLLFCEIYRRGLQYEHFVTSNSVKMKLTVFVVFQVIHDGIN